MLQFITHPSEKYSIPKEVKMAIEGGCKWVQLRMKDASYEELKATALDIIPMCKDNDVILVIDDNVELVNELRVHGVHLGKTDMDPRKAREILGPHAIIGVTANTADDILTFKRVDVDYVGLGPFRHTDTKKNLAPVIGLEGYRQIVKTVSDAGNQLPIVAIGGITIDDVDEIMSTGVQGIAVSGAIINAPSPVEYTEDILRRLAR
ncbi:thiamine phosphate synthase [Barnesiella sp. WM24]|uniref:thiamine phosphate synthase n=1 Tax=Barnesiella sp. WM24 TaxID=2558278 RepID=UPI0010719B5B|nr:thiamine phosphate synthase [Barnesiella sp. WM24]TFU94511.1 thiamine phosphate synthase [Barnesiella sp. WM24]